MKQLIALLLALICLSGSAVSEFPVTPTDLYEEYAEFEDGDAGYIDPTIIERKVFLEWLVKPKHYGDEVSLVAILVDFLPTDIYTFVWQYSFDCEEWFDIQDEHEQTYTFIFEPYMREYYFRVTVIILEE